MSLLSRGIYSNEPTNQGSNKGSSCSFTNPYATKDFWYCRCSIENELTNGSGNDRASSNKTLLPACLNYSLRCHLIINPAYEMRTMINQPSDYELENLRDQKDWVEEIKALSNLINRIEELGKNSSIRSLSGVTKRSKSWIGVSLMLLKGLKIYPEIEQLDTRNAAFVYLQKKNRVRRILQT